MVWTELETTMWMKKARDGFDATVWSGQIDPVTVTVRISMLLLLGSLWSGLVAWLFFSG